MGITARPLATAMLAAGLLLALSARAASVSPLVRPLAGAEVDWSAGTITASAGAAADMRMPSADSARPGAERRARAAALETLRTALRALVIRRDEKLDVKEIESALGRVSTARIEYQSNGGVVLWLQVRFEDLAGVGSTAPAAGGGGNARPEAGSAPASHTSAVTTTTALAVGTMELQVSPVAVAAGKEVVIRAVRYRQGPAPKDAISVRRDERGRLLFAKGTEGRLEQLAAGSVVIYVQKAVP
jgi:hypothetical protein